MSQEKQGIKETMEVLALVGVIAGFLAKELQGDGLQLTDAVKLVLKPDFQAKLAEAVSGVTSIAGEIEDLSKYEVLDLSEFVLKTTRGIVETLAQARAA
jgi:hypothetical protein